VFFCFAIFALFRIFLHICQILCNPFSVQAHLFYFQNFGFHNNYIGLALTHHQREKFELERNYSAFRKNLGLKNNEARIKAKFTNFGISLAVKISWILNLLNLREMIRTGELKILRGS